jgi:hypothetical protein
MIQDTFGQMIFNDNDLVDLLMSGRDPTTIKHMMVDHTVDLDRAHDWVNELPNVQPYEPTDLSREEFDREQQSHWHMPAEYQDLDIAEYVLSLCTGEAELQRCGHELLMYQERDLFDLLRYLKYLVDTMRSNDIIWGVGRGSSVSSFVLFKLGVHRINSLYYDLSVEEFLR